MFLLFLTSVLFRFLRLSNIGGRGLWGSELDCFAVKAMTTRNGNEIVSQKSVRFSFLSRDTDFVTFVELVRCDVVRCRPRPSGVLFREYTNKFLHLLDYLLPILCPFVGLSRESCTLSQSRLLVQFPG